MPDRSVFRADEFVEPGHRLPPGDRDRGRLREPPGHPKPVERFAAQAVYVSGPIDEEIPRVLIPAVAASEGPSHAVDGSAAVGMEEAASEIAGMVGHNFLLPGLKLDRALMFPAGTVLRKQTRPLF